MIDVIFARNNTFNDHSFMTQALLLAVKSVLNSLNESIKLQLKANLTRSSTERHHLFVPFAHPHTHTQASEQAATPAAVCMLW